MMKNAWGMSSKWFPNPCDDYCKKSQEIIFDKTYDWPESKSNSLEII